MTKLTLLALDTSTEACSVALLYNGEKTHLNELAQRAHTKRILPMIDKILANSGLHLNQVNALAFGRGPGSFTGVRVGAGIAQGLALGADLPVIPISNLTAMAQAAFELYQAKKVAAAIDARMGEVYFSQLICEDVHTNLGAVSQWREITPEQVCPPEQAISQLQNNDIFYVGTGWAAYPQFTEKNLNGSEIELPNALYMLPLAQTAWKQQQTISALEIEPIYLRNEVTWKKLPRRE